MEFTECQDTEGGASGPRSIICAPLSQASVFQSNLQVYSVDRSRFCSSGPDLRSQLLPFQRHGTEAQATCVLKILQST